MHILSIDRNKSPLQISGKVAGGACEDSKLFRAPIYWAHRAVVFAIAMLSCNNEYAYRVVRVEAPRVGAPKTLEIETPN